jgi:hypothetical protein
MYSTEQIKELQNLTSDLIKADHTDKHSKSWRICEALQFHEYRLLCLERSPGIGFRIRPLVQIASKNRTGKPGTYYGDLTYAKSRQQF